jgi:hypothetical protein
MKLTARIFVCCLAAFQLISIGCSSTPVSNSNTAVNAANSANSSNANSSNDSVEDLRSLIQIPFEPDEVTWREIKGEQNTKRLLAVLLLSPESHRSLAAKMGNPTDVQISVEQWFPAELTTMGETSGEMTIAGKAFPATEFYQPPYSTGNAILIPDTNYLILDLQAN